MGLVSTKGSRVKQFVAVTRQHGLREALLRAVSYGWRRWTSRLRNPYVDFLLSSPRQFPLRSKVLRYFRKIDQNVSCAHLPHELLVLADEVLRLPSSRVGEIIECGVFKGGSTCKLSVVARLAGRRLLACDSFAGLPQPKDYDAVHTCGGCTEQYRAGDYAGTLDEVRANVRRYGEEDCVRFICGWFQETLPALRNERFVLVFLDVDLHESLVCCIRNLWPALEPGGKLFTHEANHDVIIKAFTDREFWLREFGEEPPAFVRVGFLGYVQKPG